MQGNVNEGFEISVIDLPSKTDKDEQVQEMRKSEVVPPPPPSPNETFPKNHVLILGLSELLATALLMFLGCMGCVDSVYATPVPPQVSSFTFGLVIMILIMVFGHISGCHMNPAVTLASVYLGLLKPLVGLLYVAAQFLGAIMGFSLLKIMIPAEYVATDFYDPNTNETFHKLGLCSTVPSDKMTILQSVGMESILTCILILICCAVWDQRNAQNTDSLTLRFGLAITAIGIIGGPYTGASMNTVRSFAPALLNGDWTAQWIYWVGPTVGGFFGAVFYKACFGIPNKKERNYEIPERISLKDTITKI